MKTFTVPTREQVAPANQAIFDNLQKALGFVPNTDYVLLRQFAIARVNIVQ